MITKELLINEFRNNCEKYLTQRKYYSYYSPKVFDETKENWVTLYLDYVIDLWYNPLELIYEIIKDNIEYVEVFMYWKPIYDNEHNLIKKIFNLCLSENNIRYSHELSWYYQNDKLTWRFDEENSIKYKNLESKNPKEFQLYRNKIEELVDTTFIDYLNYEKTEYLKLKRFNHLESDSYTFYTDTKTYKIWKNYYFGFLLNDDPFFWYSNEFLVRLLKIKSAKNNARFIKKLEKILEEIKKVDVTYDEYRANMNNTNFDKTFFQFSLHPKYYPQIVAYKDIIDIYPTAITDNEEYLNKYNLKDLDSYYNTQDVIMCYEMIIKNYYKIVNE